MNSSNIYIIIFFLSILYSNSPVAIVAKSIGSIKYKNYKNKKFASNLKVKSLIYLGDEIKTGSESFIRIMYLDSPAYISLHPNSHIIINGQIDNNYIKKSLNINEGIVYINTNSINSKFNVHSQNSSMECSNCNFWIIVDPSKSLKLYNINSIGSYIDRELNKTLILKNNFTILSLPNEKITEYYTTINEYKYLEFLMDNVNEKKEVSYVEKIINRKKIKNLDKQIENVLQIKLYSTFDMEKKIIITYIEK